MSETPDLAVFLLARIGEDEQFAQASYQPRRRVESDVKRRIVELHAAKPFFSEWYCEECSPLDNGGDPVPTWPCDTIRLLALPYAAHPDYRAEWSVEATNC